MTLRKVKILYCIAMIAIGVLLAADGGWVYWLASVTILSVALPAFRLIRRVVSDERLDEAESILLAEQQRRHVAHE
jgi:hypothetical protein